MTTRARSVADIHDGSTDITTLGTVTAGTLGSGVTFPIGHVLQVETYNKTDASVYSGAASKHKPLEGGITTIGANSKFIVDIRLSHGAFNTSNRDPYDWSMQAGYRTGSPSTSVGDYIGFGGRTGTLANNQNLGMTGHDYPLYQSDVPEGGGIGGEWGSWGSDYEIRQKAFVLELSPNISANTLVYFALWIRVSQYLVVSGPDYVNGGNTYNGAISSMAVYEVST